MLMEFTALGMIIPLSPYLAKDFGADDLQVGLLMSVYALAQLLFAPVWGYLSDRFGRRPILLICLFGASLFYLWFALAETLSTLFITRIAGGLFGAVMSLAMACIADFTGTKDRSKNMGLVGAAIGLGFVIGPFLGAGCSWLGEYLGSAPPFGSQFTAFGAFIVCSINFLVTFLLFPRSARVADPMSTDKVSMKEKGYKSARVADPMSTDKVSMKEKGYKSVRVADPMSTDKVSMKEKGYKSVRVADPKFFMKEKGYKSVRDAVPPAVPSKKQSFLFVLRQPVLRNVLFMYFLLTLALAGIEAVLFLYVKDKLSWSHFPASLGFTYIGLMMVFTQGFLVRKLIPIYGEYKTVLCGFVIGGLGFVGVGLSNWLWPIALSVTFLSIGYSLASVGLSGTVSLLSSPHQQGGIFGVHQSLFSIARIIGPALGGWLYRDFNPSAPFYMSTFMILCAMVVGIFTKEGMVKKQTSPH